MKVFTLSVLCLLTVQLPWAWEEMERSLEANEASYNQVTFSPVGETWATNVYDISIQACAVNMPDLSFSMNTAVYRLRPGDTASSYLGEATVLKRPRGLKEGTLSFVIGRGRDRESVPCVGAGVLYGDLPSSPVTFRLTRADKDGDLSCAPVEAVVE